MRWAAELVDCSPSRILDVSASINPLGPPEGAIAAIHDRFADLCHYPDPGYHHLRQALGAFHDIDPEWIFPGNGAAELFTWIARDVAEQTARWGGQTHLLTPAFGDYDRALSAYDASVTRHSLQLEPAIARWASAAAPNSSECTHSVDVSSVLPRGDGRRSPDAQATPLPSMPALTGKGNRDDGDANLLSAQDCLWLNTPHNPSGLVFSASSLEPYCESMGRVVVDEAFMDFLRPHRQQSLLPRIEAYPNLVVVRSLTKFYSLPGLRIGYAIAHPDQIRRWQAWRDPWAVNVLAEAAAIASLEDTAFQERTWQWLDEARPQLIRGLMQIPGLSVIPGAANFVLVQATCSVTALQHWLLVQHQILIRDCMSFPGLGDRYFRLAVRTLDENDRVLQAIAAGMDAMMNERPHA
jgi:L-threonine-O-3-phosphate decarboxylase